MFRFPYLIIKTRLLAEVPELKYIDWDYGQDSQTGENVLHIAPACFISFEPAETNQQGRGVQWADIFFNVRLVTDCIYDNDKRVHNASPLLHDKLNGKVYKALNGFWGMLSYVPEFSTLKDTASDYKIIDTIQRVGTTPDHTFSNLIRTPQRFRCKAWDFDANQIFNNIVAEIEIENTEI